MPVLNQTSIANVVAKLAMCNQDKKAVVALFNGMADDIEQLRAAVAALTAKLDTAGGSVAGLGTNFTATVAVPKTNLNLKKS